MAWTGIAQTVPQYEDSSGLPYSGAVIKFYAAGTSTVISLATDSTGGTTATSVALNANGFPEISGSVIIPYLQETFKISLYATQAAADANSGAIWTVDNVAVAAASSDEWQPSGLTPTRVTNTQFTVVGDSTADFHKDRRLRSTDSGGTDYSTVVSSSYADPTCTVNVAVDSGGTLDAGLSAVDFSILSGDNSALPAIFKVYAQTASIGTDTSTLAITPAISGYFIGLEISYKAGGTNTTTTTLNVNSLGAKTIKRTDGNNLSAGDITANDMVTVAYDGTNFILTSVRVIKSGEFAAGAIATADVATGAITEDKVANGAVVQMVNTIDGAVATGTTVIPNDDTTPLYDEGDEYITLAITPQDTTNKLKIDVVLQLSHSVTGAALGAALFQDGTGTDPCIAAGRHGSIGTSVMTTVAFTHYMTAGTVSSTTFQVRAGSSSAGTTTFNGTGAARKWGGILSSTITITEIKA